MPFALALPALILLAAVVGYPLLTIVLRSLSEPAWGLQNYVWFFGTPVNLVVLRRTFLISAWEAVFETARQAPVPAARPGWPRHWPRPEAS